MKKISKKVETSNKSENQNYPPKRLSGLYLIQEIPTKTRGKCFEKCRKELEPRTNN